MVHVLDVRTVGDALQLGAAAVAVWGLGHALFASFAAAELRARFARRNARRLAEVDVLRWELQNRRRYSRERAAGDQLAAQAALTEAELAERRARYEVVVRSTLGMRVLGWALDCGFCHAAWAAVLLLVCLGPLSWHLVTDTCALAALASAAGRLADCRGGAKAGGCQTANRQ